MAISPALLAAFHDHLPQIEFVFELAQDPIVVFASFVHTKHLRSAGPDSAVRAQTGNALEPTSYRSREIPKRLSGEVSAFAFRPPGRGPAGFGQSLPMPSWRAIAFGRRLTMTISF